jgi:pilus assembly protein CpaC
MTSILRATLVALSLLSAPGLASPPEVPAPAAAEETLTVRAGGAKTLSVPGVTRVALGDPEIADVEVTEGDELRIDGRKAGETKLLVWTGKVRKAYRIVVQN